MQIRTFVRIMIENLFINNAFCKAIKSLVNFCYEQSYFNNNNLKFLEKMPIYILKKKKKGLKGVNYVRANIFKL